MATKRRARKSEQRQFRKPFYAAMDAIEDLLDAASEAGDPKALRLAILLEDNMDVLRAHLNANYRWD